MNQNQFYCLRCRKRVTINTTNISITRFNKNKSPAMVGNCKSCGTFVSKFICVDDEDKLIKKYGEY
jgi:hypothetical protein